MSTGGRQHPTRAPTSLDSIPVTALRGVGPRVAERLARLGVDSVAALLFHLPLRYQDKSRLTPMAALQPGQEALLEGEVLAVGTASGRRPSLVCRLADASGSVELRFFHYGASLQNRFRRGQRLRCFGEVRSGFNGLEMIHPELQFSVRGVLPTLDTALTPIYPTTEGLRQATLRALTDQSLALLDGVPVLDESEWLPDALRSRFRLPGLHEAVKNLHRPPAGTEAAALLGPEHPCRRRLAFEELLAHHLALRQQRDSVKSCGAARIESDGALRTRFLESLPFGLTAAQQRVIADIVADLSSATPMLRLLQGDVGAGKTLVAAAAIVEVAAAGSQAAVMAPTELLSEQHQRSLTRWLEPLGIGVVWLTGSLSAGERRTALERIETGSARVVVGTHALFQAAVDFDDLALVVIDEQHRFGVHQRLALRDKSLRSGRVAHQLVMTATPIPRTLAMTAYADLDRSVLDELPPGRQPVNTVVVADQRREDVVRRVESACRDGRQAYWVCTLIEDSEALQCQAAEETASFLRQRLPGVRIGLVHGRLTRAEKEVVMTAFSGGELDLLVATTVIEVGVDVPNATLMIVENAERLGLAQLHQIRGRVGRGSTESFCVLMYHGPLSPKARARLQVLRASNDGFEIARRDLEIRGPGEMLGTRQTGMLEFRVADLARHQDMLEDVHESAKLLRQHPSGRGQVLAASWLGNDRDYGAA